MVVCASMLGRVLTLLVLLPPVFMSLIVIDNRRDDNSNAVSCSSMQSIVSEKIQIKMTSAQLKQSGQHAVLCAAIFQVTGVSSALLQS
jgi:hypothetical protein